MKFFTKRLLSRLTAVLLVLFPVISASALAEGGGASESSDGYESSILIDADVNGSNGMQGGKDEKGGFVLIAGTSAEGNAGINGSWPILSRGTQALCFSLTLEKQTEAIPAFTFRIRDSVKKFHTAIFSVNSAGEIRMFGSTLGNLNDGAIIVNGKSTPRDGYPFSLEMRF